MKMTRLEWRYLQKVALDHPYFDTHKLPLTEREAKAIVEANIKMTGKEFVDSIYAKLGMTRPEEEKKRFAWLRNIGELFTVPPIRKIAIAVLVVILMTVLFAATPTGRAIAESVIQYIATLFDDGSIVTNRTDNEGLTYAVEYDGFAVDEAQDLCDDSSTDFIEINSFEEFTMATGKNPFALQLPYTKMYFEYDNELDYLALYVVYDTEKGKITSCQIWNMEMLVSSTSTGFVLLDAGESIYYSVENEEGYVQCQKVLEDSVFIISSNNNYQIDDLVELLR